MERERISLKHEEIVQPFLIDAFKEGAHRKMLKHTPKDQSFKQLMIGVVYNDIGSMATLEELAEKHNAFKQSIAKSNKGFLRKLWDSSSPELKEKYSLDEILAARKPLTQRSKERISQSHGGKSISIREHMDSGESIQQIRKEGSYSTVQIGSARRTLKGWGAGELEYVITPAFQNLELEKSLKKAETDQKKQEYLNQVKREFLEHHRRGNDPLLTSIRNIFMEAGFTHGFQSKNSPILLASLKYAGFPIGELQETFKKEGKYVIRRHYFTLAKDKERAKQILLADPNLQRFRRS